MYSSDSTIPPLPEFNSLLVRTDAPVQSEIFPDGRKMEVSGETEAFARSLVLESDSDDRLHASSSLFGCAQIIRQFMPDFRVSDLVDYEQNQRDPHATSDSCLLAPEALAQTLSEFDVPAHVEQAQSAEDLAHHLESGAGALVMVNLGELWNSASAYGNGDANAVAVAVAVARDPLTGDIEGWYLNDVTAHRIRVLVSAAQLQRAWMDIGGLLIVTEIARTRRVE